MYVYQQKAYIHKLNMIKHHFTLMNKDIFTVKSKLPQKYMLMGTALTDKKSIKYKEILGDQNSLIFP